jgi:undecaprenyl diphosphate synthase
VQDVIDPTRVPTHVACVMDGNGRWASERNLPRTEGHAAGEQALVDTVDAALELGISWLTVYAFSTENWRRPIAEVRYLMNFNEQLLLRRRDELNDKGVRIKFVGRRDWRIPRRLLRRIDESEALTKENSTLTLSIAFNYGSRAELVDAVRALNTDGVEPSESAISERMYDPSMPDVDLWIRTSGEHRISNFLLWQSAYAEFVFVDAYWPDFGGKEMYEAVEEFQRRNRRFGGL